MSSYIAKYKYYHIATNIKIFHRFVVQKRLGNGSLEATNVSVRNCYYTGSVAGHLFSRVTMSMCDGEMVKKLKLNCHMHTIFTVLL